MRRQEDPAVLAPIVIGTVVAALVLVAVLDWRSKRHAVQARFWFDNVTFELPGRGNALQAPLTKDEQKRIQSIALQELRTAFEGLRVAFLEDAAGFYRVRVIQQFPSRPGGPGPVGTSRPMGLLGGEGSVSFEAVAAHAMHYAPPAADRTTIVEGIARGIGRTAAHEFAHQILFGEHVPPSADTRSYEYESPQRVEQYYGSMHWDTAWPFLARKLGRQHPIE